MLSGYRGGTPPHSTVGKAERLPMGLRNVLRLPRGVISTFYGGQGRTTARGTRRHASWRRWADILTFCSGHRGTAVLARVPASGLQWRASGHLTMGKIERFVLGFVTAHVRVCSSCEGGASSTHPVGPAERLWLGLEHVLERCEGRASCYSPVGEAKRVHVERENLCRGRGPPLSVLQWARQNGFFLGTKALVRRLQEEAISPSSSGQGRTAVPGIGARFCRRREGDTSLSSGGRYKTVVTRKDWGDLAVVQLARAEGIGIRSHVPGLLWEATWPSLNGQGRTDAIGTNPQVLTPPRKDIFSFSSGQGRTAVLGMSITVPRLQVGGHLDVLQWARHNSCPWTDLTCLSSAAAGHLDIIEWARRHGWPFHRKRCVRAARRGRQQHVCEALSREAD